MLPTVSSGLPPLPCGGQVTALDRQRPVHTLNGLGRSAGSSGSAPATKPVLTLTPLPPAARSSTPACARAIPALHRVRGHHPRTPGPRSATPPLWPWHCPSATSYRAAATLRSGPASAPPAPGGSQQRYAVLGAGFPHPKGHRLPQPPGRPRPKPCPAQPPQAEFGPDPPRQRLSI